MHWIDPLNLLRVLLLTPIAFASAFTAFPVVERAMLPTTWLEMLLLSAILVMPYAYFIGAIVWVIGWKAERRFLGLSKTAWLVLAFMSFGIGLCSVILIALA
jgi:hypothetical protein